MRVESSDRSLSQTAPWGELLRDVQQRVSIVDRIVSQMGNDDIPMVDRAVVAILHHVGLPRGPRVRGPIVEPVGHGWAGRKAPDCRLLIDTEEFHDLHGVIRADSLLKTWFHESIHGRQPFAPGSAEEWRLHRGFEEGLAEGLARSLSQELGLQPVLGSFNYYVAAYRALAVALEIPAEALWRRLWRYPAGTVATAFMREVEGMLARHGHSPLVPLQRVRLFARARSVFSTTNSVQSVDEDRLLQGWREVLP